MRAYLLFFLFFPFILCAENLLPINQSYTDSLLENYSGVEKLRIKKDYDVIRDFSFDRKESVDVDKRPIYIATAAGPGAGKTTILETYMHNHHIENNIVYVDPDHTALRSMIHTYIPSLSAYNVTQTNNYKELLATAYEKWRSGSNYIANMIFNEAVSKRMNIAHGTTSTSPVMDRIYTRLKAHDYEIVLLLCGASDDARLRMINHRETSQAFAQSNHEDMLNKGKLFPQRFDTYFKHADRLYIYWTEDYRDGNQLAAIYTPQSGLIVKDQTALDKFQKTHGKLPI